ncbi:MAG: DUF3810 family protein [Candidatus Eremiobacteraeota bacterium]|nr:DUF3810 family protein [Candidatus Eremiobacteraeota bacterium]
MREHIGMVVGKASPEERVELAIEVAIVLIAAVLWIARPPAEFLQGFYAIDFYPNVQNGFTRWTNQIPFAAGDLFCVLVIGAVILLWIVSLRRSRDRIAIGRLVLRTVAIAAFLYVWFLVAWGWNYDQDALARPLGYDAAAVQRWDVDALEDALVDALNATAPSAHMAHGANPDTRARLRQPYRDALPFLGVPEHVVLTRPKHTLLDPWFVATGISGMFFPYTFETYLASDVLWFEYPFDLSHEWGHLAGVARESDANFVGAVTTLRSPDPLIRYSGLILVYSAMPRIARHDARLSPLVQSDYNEMRRRNERHIKPLAFKFAWNTYDRYLKSQHVASGVVNYTEYVSLLLGTDVGRAAIEKAVGKPLTPKSAQ